MKPRLIQFAIVIALMLAWSVAVYPLTQINRLFSQLVDLADVILVGTVNDTSTEWGQGQLANSIFTVATLDDLNVIKGGVQGVTYELRYAGGQIGEMIHHYEGMPRLTVGTRYVLFISSDTNLLFPVVGIGQGVFIVTQDSGEPTETIQTVGGRDVLGILGDHIHTSGPGERVTFDQFAICIEDQMMGTFPEFCRPARAAQYYNSAELGCDGTDSTVLFCDDLEDGSWAETDGDTNGGRSNPDNDGWSMTIFSSLGFPDAEGTGYARCGSKGVAGTDCAATSGEIPASPGGQIMGKHRFAPSETGYTEVYVRWYIKQLPGFVMGHEKMMTLQNDNSYQCCIMTKNFGSGNIVLDSLHDSGNMSQNQGNTLTLENNKWYYVEYRVKLNTIGQANGIYQLWMDDCGTDGLGCTGQGTLRASYTDRIFRKNSGDDMNLAWLENWGNPSSTGEEYYDQFYVATRRVGPM